MAGLECIELLGTGSHRKLNSEVVAGESAEHKSGSGSALHLERRVTMNNVCGWVISGVAIVIVMCLTGCRTCSDSDRSSALEDPVENYYVVDFYERVPVFAEYHADRVAEVCNEIMDHHSSASLLMELRAYLDVMERRYGIGSDEFSFAEERVLIVVRCCLEGGRESVTHIPLPGWVSTVTPSLMAPSRELPSAPIAVIANVPVLLAVPEMRLSREDVRNFLTTYAYHFGMRSAHFSVGVAAEDVMEALERFDPWVRAMEVLDGDTGTAVALRVLRQLSN
jgi:hypothetical protein